MTPSWARVGAKVVCVDDKPSRLTDDRLLERGTTYTIASVVASAIDGSGTPSGTCIHLAEISRGPCAAGYVVPWYIARFRPLVTRTQTEDVAQFEPLLRPDPITRLDYFMEEMDQ